MIMTTPASASGETTTAYDEETISKAYEEALDDVHTRFLLNLPPEELSSSNRVFFQLEQAWWFYDDFHCDHSDIPLPRFKSVKPFCLKMFQWSPLLKPMLPQFSTLWDDFSSYKRTISTYGTILLNSDCTKAVLCQVWNGKSWTFPAGKVNQNEHGIDAGARETYEETGFDPNCEYGLTKTMKEQTSALPWKALEQENALVWMDGDKRRTCYVCRGVPENFPFSPVARKEVSAIEWHELDNLPKKNFAVLPFVSQLRRWIRQQNKSSRKSKSAPKQRHPRSSTPSGRSESAPSRKSRSRNNSRGKVRDDDDPLVNAGLAQPGDVDGWDEDAMFEANEKILGRKITYDGNPHFFAEQGFDGKDPHAFHVVGGTFMNSQQGIAKLAPPPKESKLQPLFCKQEPNDDGFQPFFSEAGETPWGEVVEDALSGDDATTPKRAKDKNKKISKAKGDEAEEIVMSPDEAGQALLKILQQPSTRHDDVEPSLEVFMTDAEITARSQKEKLELAPATNAERQRDDMTAEAFLKQWVKGLPPGQPTKQFGDFRFDVDAIMNAMNLGVKS